MEVHGLTLAVRTAKTKARHATFRHAALVMKGKRVVAVGSNHEETHAEEDALLNLRFGVVGPYRRLPKGFDLLSIRITRGGKLSMARPCEGCMALIRLAGIRRVYYTDGSGEMQVERVIP